MKYLIVFDFDHTLLDDNSDTAVIGLVDKELIPQEIKTLQHREGWTAFMQGVFNFLHEKGVTAEEIIDLIKSLPPVKGVLNLAKEMKKKGIHDLIIISDCNSYFINMWLQKQGVDKCFQKIFTNPSQISNGVFKISPYHDQTTCKLSTRNLCKGQVLDEFIAEQQKNGVSYDKVVYIGDGVNDFCPVLRLSKNDIACVRNRYKLHDLVTKAKKGSSFDNSGKPHNVKAEVFIWDSGDDILKRLNS